MVTRTLGSSEEGFHSGGVENLVMLGQRKGDKVIKRRNMGCVNIPETLIPSKTSG